MGGGSGGGGDQVQQTIPWGPQGTELRRGFKQARNLYQGSPFEMYPGQTFAGVNSDIADSWNQTRNLAQGPNAGAQANDYLSNLFQSGGRESFVDPASRQYMQSATNGDYLNSNPYLDRMSDIISKKTMAQANNAFAGSGRTQSGAQARGVTSALADANTMLYGNNYARERGMQQQAAGQLANLNQMDQNLSNSDFEHNLRGMAALPTTQQAMYTPSSQLMNIGEQRRSANQLIIDEAMNRHQFSQEEPWQRLERYMGIVGAGSPGSTTTASGGGMERNRTTGALGGAATGAMIGSQILPGWGTAIGGVAGGLYGAFG